MARSELRRSPAAPASRDRSRRRLSRRGRVVFGASLALALPLVVACNALTGLSDFEKGACAGGPCPDEGGKPDQLTDDRVATDAPTEAKGADPVSWAKWPMPNYLVEGGAGLPQPSPALVKQGGGTVLDRVTKLVWSGAVVPGDFTAAEADARCQALPNGGPWRAPKRIELVTLLDYSRNTYVDRDKFTDLKNYRVWTTSEVRPFKAGDPDQAYWTVSFETGTVEPRPGSDVAKVLCVRAR
jgi:hypothetical protein